MRTGAAATEEASAPAYVSGRAYAANRFTQNYNRGAGQNFNRGYNQGANRGYGQNFNRGYGEADNRGFGSSYGNFARPAFRQNYAYNSSAGIGRNSLPLVLPAAFTVASPSPGGRARFTAAANSPRAATLPHRALRLLPGALIPRRSVRTPCRPAAASPATLAGSAPPVVVDCAAYGGGFGGGSTPTVVAADTSAAAAILAAGTPGGGGGHRPAEAAITANPAA